MTSLRKLVWWMLALVSTATWAAPADVGSLLQLLATVKSGEATFTEQRQVTLQDMTRTLESSGRLSFAAPDTFVRETLKPRRERLAVAGNTLTMSQGSRSRSVPLDTVPEAQVLVEAVRGTLTGNRELLDRHFTLQFNGSLDQWTLELVPREPLLREQVARVTVTGVRAALTEVQVQLAGGDRSTMKIVETRAP
jgi:outer membrane lipoprotein-sorting protein